MEKEAKAEPPGQRALKSMSRSTKAQVSITGQVCASVILERKINKYRIKKVLNMPTVKSKKLQTKHEIK